GLFFEVWESGSPATRVAVVFRGTDGWSDWESNLRWFTRFIPFVEDQYHFVSRRVSEEVSARLAGSRSRYGPAFELVTVGHSLGGGLAQHFAYALRPATDVPRVSRVFAFDPSPVTGFYSVSRDVRDANKTGLRIDRIFEHGEVLAYVR